MSNPKTLTCHETAMKLYEFIDGELTIDIENAVRAHLADCDVCTSLYNFESAFMRFLRARASARAAPAHLRKRVFEDVLCEDDETGAT